MKLTATQIRNVKPDKKLSRLFDGHGLYLEISPKGKKVWRQKYRLNGKGFTETIGDYPDISLADARERSVDIRRAAKRTKSIAPVANPQNIPLFGDAKQKWFDHHKRTVAASTAATIEHHLAHLQQLDPLPLDQITAQDVLTLLRRLEADGLRDTVHRVKFRISQIYKFSAVEFGLVTLSDPTAMLGPVLVPNKHTSYAAATTPAAFKQVLKAVWSYEGAQAVKVALRLLPLVFTRPGELRLADWSEISFEEQLWRIPAERTKMRRELLVPLSTQAMRLLEEWHGVQSQSASGLVFPGLRHRDRAISENTINAALRQVGISKEQQTGHGFRSSAATILNEVRSERPEIIELQLGHAIAGVRGIYVRAQFLDERRAMMQRWSDYCYGLLDE